MSMTEFKLKDIVDSMPPEYSEFVRKGNQILVKQFSSNNHGLTRVQGNISYYLPTYEETMDFYEHDYFSKDKGIIRFQKYLIRKLNVSKQDVNFISLENYLRPITIPWLCLWKIIIILFLFR